MRTVDRICVGALREPVRVERKFQNAQAHSRVDAYLAWILWYPKVVILVNNICTHTLHSLSLH